MSKLPRTPEEHFAYWQECTGVKYGYCHCGCGEKTRVSPVNRFRLGHVRGCPVFSVQGHGIRFRPNRIKSALQYQEWWRREQPRVPYGYCWCGCGKKTSISKYHRARLNHFKGEPVPYLPGHFGVQPTYQTEDCGYESPCWIWTGHINQAGYGRKQMPGNRQAPAHRWMYEQVYGPVSKHLHMDHLCRVTECVNPDHLEPVLPAENVRRGKSVKYTKDKLALAYSLHNSGMLWGEVAEALEIDRRTLYKWRYGK